MDCLNNTLFLQKNGLWDPFWTPLLVMPSLSPSAFRSARRTSLPLSPSSHVYSERTFAPLSPAFSSLPWFELEQQGSASRAWCRVARLPHGSYGLALNDFNVLTQKPSNPLCTLKQFDLVVEVDGVPLQGRLCDELNAGGSIVLTVLRPTVSVDQLLRGAAKLGWRKGGSASANPSPNGSRDGSPRDLSCSANPSPSSSPSGGGRGASSALPSPNSEWRDSPRARRGEGTLSAPASRRPPQAPLSSTSRRSAARRPPESPPPGSGVNGFPPYPPSLRTSPQGPRRADHEDSRSEESDTESESFRARQRACLPRTFPAASLSEPDTGHRV